MRLAKPFAVMIWQQTPYYQEILTETVTQVIGAVHLVSLLSLQAYTTMILMA